MVTTNRTVVFHIGHHKTGTTALQRFLAGSRTELQHVGVIYPSVGIIDGAHHGFSLALKTQADGGTADDLGRFRNLWEQVLRNTQKNEFQKILISSEDLCLIKDFRLWSEATKIIRGDGFSIKILCYIRRADYYVESVFKQITKIYDHRNTEPFNLHSDYVLDRFGVFSYFNALCEALGPLELDLKVYPENFKRNYIQKFLASERINLEVRESVSENDSLTVGQTEILRNINALVPTIGKSTFLDLTKFVSELSALPIADKNYTYFSFPDRVRLLEASSFDEQLCSQHFGLNLNEICTNDLRRESSFVEWDELDLSADISKVRNFFKL